MTFGLDIIPLNLTQNIGLVQDYNMKKIFFILLFIFPPVFSKAAIAVEPYIGIGASCASQLGCFDLRQAYHVPSIGSRFGYGFLKIAMLGLDVSYNRYDPFSRVEGSSFTQERGEEQGISQLQATPSNESMEDFIKKSLSAYNTWDVGPTIIIDLPLLFDGYASLIFSHSSQENLFLNGTGFKIGASYLTVPLMSVNLEFKLVNYFACTLKDDLSPCLEQQGILGPMYTFSVFLSVPIKTGFL